MEDYLLEWHQTKKVREIAVPNWSEEDVIMTQYYNPATSEWTQSELQAFKGFVMSKLEKTINNIWNG